MKAALLVVLFPLILNAQTDTVVVYDYPSQSESLYFPVAYDSTILFDSTSWYIGNFNSNVELLDLSVPVSNLIYSTNFSYLTPAADSYNRENYPIRTVVSLGKYVDDTVRTSCTGTLIGDRWVLTAAHCLINSITHTWFGDTVIVQPGYDNAETISGIGTAQAIRAFAFKTFKDGTNWNDLALLELDQPIGNLTGWVGLGYAADSAFYENNIFHKFSYPATSDPFHPWAIYNGDTMYYNHGLIDYLHVSAPDLGLEDPNATGIPGQSGSTFMFTDNVNQYLAFGVFSLSYYYRHKNLTIAQFNMFKSIMETFTGIDDQNLEITELNIYPNPMSVTAYVQNTVPVSDELLIYDQLGALVRTIPATASTIQIDRTTLSAGLYFCQLIRNGTVNASGKLVVR